MEVDPLLKRILIVSILLWMTVIHPIYGQRDPSISDLPNNWHPNTPYLYNPYKQNSYSLIMPYDSSTYVGRNLIRLPFVVVRNIDIAKDWSTITFTGKLLGESLNVPFVAPLEWYLDRQMKINREVAMFKAIQDTAKTRGGQSQILQDNRGRGIEVIGLDVGRLGRVSLSARGNVTLKGNLVFQDQN